MTLPIQIKLASPPRTQNRNSDPEPSSSRSLFQRSSRVSQPDMHAARKVSQRSGIESELPRRVAFERVIGRYFLFWS